MKDVLAVAGSLAQRPHRGGHAWVFLQYLLGFRRLGYDVLFLDRLAPGMSVDAQGTRAPVEHSVNARYLAEVMQGAGLAGSWALLHDEGRGCLGLSRTEVLARLGRAPLLLDVMGFLDDPELLAAPARRVFLDIDPGFGQMWRALGQADLFQGHDAYATVGENIGRADCSIPTVDIPWVTTRPPVVLEHWPVVPAPRTDRFTAVGSWRGAFAPVEYDGVVHGLRVHEFRRFLELPRDTAATFDLALDIDPAEVPDLERLDAAGWGRTDPRTVAATPASYRAWIQGSSAELMVAKGMYATTRSGWFSDRSACYLASGRPVLAQDTGLDGLYPLGEGLVTFSSYDEAVEGVRQITQDHARHAAAGRRVAQECFDSDRVLARLLERVG